MAELNIDLNPTGEDQIGKSKGDSKNAKKDETDKNDRQPRKCFKCGKVGHIKRFCKSREKSGNAAEEETDASFTAVIEECETGDENENNQNDHIHAFNSVADSSENDWIIDSSASKHCVKNKMIMNNVKTGKFGKLVVANNNSLEIIARGDVNLALPKAKIHVTDAIYVPEIKSNLLSVFKICSEGNKVVFTQEGCTIYNSEGKVLAFVKPENGLYELKGTSAVCLLANSCLPAKDHITIPIPDLPLSKVKPPASSPTNSLSTKRRQEKNTPKLLNDILAIRHFSTPPTDLQKTTADEAIAIVCDKYFGLVSDFVRRKNAAIYFSFENEPGLIIDFKTVSNSVHINCKGLEKEKISARLFANLLFAKSTSHFKNKGQPFSIREKIKFGDHLTNYLLEISQNDNAGTSNSRFLQNHLKSISTDLPIEAKIVELTAVSFYLEDLLFDDSNDEYWEIIDSIPHNWYKNFLKRLEVLKNTIDEGQFDKIQQKTTIIACLKKNFLYILFSILQVIVLLLLVGSKIIWGPQCSPQPFPNFTSLINSTPMTPYLNTAPIDLFNTDNSTIKSVFETRSFFTIETSTNHPIDVEPLKNEMLQKLRNKYKVSVDKGENLKISYFMNQDICSGENNSNTIALLLKPPFSEKDLNEFNEKCRSFAELYKIVKKKRVYSPRNRVDAFKEFFKTVGKNIAMDIKTCCQYNEAKSIISRYLSDETEEFFPNVLKCDAYNENCKC